MLRALSGRPAWPLMVKAGGITDDPEATFMISYAHREEKGSDVNVATHLLIDVLNAQVDVAMVISNDSDLSLPIRCARDPVPVGDQFGYRLHRGRVEGRIQ